MSKHLLRQELRMAVDEAHLSLQLNESISQFQQLWRHGGMSRIESGLVEQELIRDATFVRIPVLQRIVRVITSCMRLSVQIRELAHEREKLVHQLRHESCAINSKIPCSQDCHRQTCSVLFHIDALTVELVELIVQWRRHQTWEQPFLFQVSRDGDKENLLFRFVIQYSMGCDISLACAHLRTTSRHTDYFYASPFDAVSSDADHAQRKDRLPDLTMFDSIHSLWRYVKAEGRKQTRFVGHQLQAARMGQYQPVLKAVVMGCKNACVSGVIHVKEKCTKEQLVRSFSFAAEFLKRTQPKDVSSASALAGFATFSTKSLHVRYYRRWIEWVSLRGERLSRAAKAVALVHRQHLLVRFGTWMRFLQSVRERALRWKPMLSKVNTSILRRYVRKWFTIRAMAVMARKIRRAAFLRYFHSLHLHAIHHRQEQLLDAAGRHPKLKVSVDVRGWETQSVALLSAHCTFAHAFARYFVMQTPLSFVEREEAERRAFLARFEEAWDRLTLFGESKCDQFRINGQLLLANGYV